MNQSKTKRLYQINIRNFLKEQKVVNILQIPIAFWESLEINGIDSIWLMGVWQICLASKEKAELQTYDLDELKYTKNDIVGSCFAIEDYIFDVNIGNSQDFLRLKQILNNLGIKLILDFIPNHFGMSSSLIFDYPEIFLESQELVVGSSFEFMTKFGKKYFYHGKDPHFDSWNDTVQIDYSKKATHDFMTKKLENVAKYCDGVRCDMTMLVLPEVFSKTWNIDFDEENIKNTCFWQEVVPVMKKQKAEIGEDFIFLAEVYWDLEKAMLDFGFDFVYNKKLLDNLKKKQYQEVINSIQLPNGILFLENHDEDRSSKIFDNNILKLCFVLLCFCPNLQFFQHGQWQLQTIRVPIQVCIPEISPQQVNNKTRVFYDKILQYTAKNILLDNFVYVLSQLEERLIAITWQNQVSKTKIVLVINFLEQKQSLNINTFLEQGSEGSSLQNLVKIISFTDKLTVLADTKINKELELTTYIKPYDFIILEIGLDFDQVIK